MTSDRVTDVLVIGGGLAAISAAIAAAEAGAAVIVANKGVTGTAGSSAKAAGILAAPFGHGGLDGQPVDDSPTRHAADSLVFPSCESLSSISGFMLVSSSKP